MLLRREIEDPRRYQRLEQVRPAELDLPRLAPSDVVLIHVWEALFELEGDALPHHPNRVDCVRERLRLRSEEVAYQHSNVAHDAPPRKKL